MMNYRVLNFYYQPEDEFGNIGHTRAVIFMIHERVKKDVNYGTFLMEQANKRPLTVSHKMASDFKNEFLSIIRGK